ncbi:MAG: hypothetical protein R2795_16220 [Saprospiraceae bacterium]
MKIDRNSNFWAGLAAGLAIPFVGYALLMMVLEYLADSPMAAQGLNFDFRARTQTLLALALNLLPLRYFLRRQSNFGLRGVVTATMVYALFWMYFFGRQMLGA